MLVYMAKTVKILAHEKENNVKRLQKQAGIYRLLYAVWRKIAEG